MIGSEVYFQDNQRLLQVFSRPRFILVRLGGLSQVLEAQCHFRMIGPINLCFDFKNPLIKSVSVFPLTQSEVTVRAPLMIGRCWRKCLRVRWKVKVEGQRLRGEIMGLIQKALSLIEVGYVFKAVGDLKRFPERRFRE